MKIKITLILFTTILVGLLSACCIGEPPIETPINPLDNNRYEDAVNTLNLDKCKEIENDELKTNCLQTIESEMIIEEAITNVNLARCNDIVLKQYKDYCKERVEEEIERQKQIEQEKLQEQENVKIHQEALDNLNLKTCEKIVGDELQVSQCKDNIYQTKATQENDQSLCEDIQDNNIKENCLASF